MYIYIYIYGHVNEAWWMVGLKFKKINSSKAKHQTISSMIPPRWLARALSLATLSVFLAASLSCLDCGGSGWSGPFVGLPRKGAVLGGHARKHDPTAG